MKALCFRSLQSVSEIAMSIDRSIPSTTKLINELASEGFAESVGLGPSTGGRPALRYNLNLQNLPLILSIAIDQYYCSAALLNFDHSYFSDIRTIRNPLKENDAYVKLLSLIREVLALADNRKVFAIGVSSPGFVHIEQGINMSYDEANPFHHIKRNLEAEFGIQTILENDSATIAIAEKYFGSYQISKDVMVVNLNWGVGLGMIIDGKLFRGHSGFAGEFSHIPLSDRNTLCSCGKRGCLEAEASLLSAINYATDAIKRGENSALQECMETRGYITGESLIDASKKKDSLALSAIDHIAYGLGKGLATLIHLINPEHIILSGRGALLAEIITKPIESSLQKYTIERLRMQTQFSVSEVENPQILGGACLAIEHADYALL